MPPKVETGNFKAPKVDASPATKANQPTKADGLMKHVGIQFEAQDVWKPIFDKHAEFIQSDIRRQLAMDRVIVYLSCPVSSRGGSFSMTNIEVAAATAQRLNVEWGDRFWFLNPASYQLESPEGTGLIKQHAALLQLSGKYIEELAKKSQPGGGDYMRMWTQVLVEDDNFNLGEYFSAFYFAGPSDFRSFFTSGGKTSVSAGVEAYFARRLAVDEEFNRYFSPPFTDEKGSAVPKDKEREHWEARRKEFLRYYTVRAGAGFSRGCHDEWNLWVRLNHLRRDKKELGVGEQIPGFFEGRQIDPATAEQTTSPGYQAKMPDQNLLNRIPRPPAPTNATSRSKAAQTI